MMDEFYKKTTKSRRTEGAHKLHTRPPITLYRINTLRAIIQITAGSLFFQHSKMFLFQCFILL